MPEHKKVIKLRSARRYSAKSSSDGKSNREIEPQEREDIKENDDSQSKLDGNEGAVTFSNEKSLLLKMVVIYSS